MGCCGCSLIFYSGLFVAIIVIIKLYLKLTTGWCRSPVCLVGKTTIVTGSNTGIGYETALDFAKRGARVILACRNLDKAEEAKNRIIQESGNQNIIVKYVDISKLDTVRKFAADINATEKRIDILVNNAGVGGLNDKRSSDGLHLLTQINYYGPFLLTILLIQLLKKSAPSRIVNVSSLMARFAKLNLNNVDNLDKFFGHTFTYANSKLCNILFTKELAARLEGTGVTAYSLHPGLVKTDIFRRFTGVQEKITYLILDLFAKTSEEGAQTTIYTAVTKGVECFNGEHFHDCQKVNTYSTANKPELGKKVWEKTIELVQLEKNELQL